LIVIGFPAKPEFAFPFAPQSSIGNPVVAFVYVPSRRMSVSPGRRVLLDELNTLENVRQGALTDVPEFELFPVGER